VGDTPEGQQYRQTLVEWGEATEAAEIETANRLFTLNHSQFKNLRETPEGQAAITGLLADTNALRSLCSRDPQPPVVAPRGRIHAGVLDA
jgi:hypothetical protein